MLYLEKGKEYINNSISVINNTYCKVDDKNIMRYYEETIVDGLLYEVNEIIDEKQIQNCKTILIGFYIV